MPGDWWQQRATVRALLAFMWSFPGKQLLFMGSELADEREWSEQRGLDWSMLDDPAHAGVAQLVADLNAAYRARAGAVVAGHHAGGLPLDRRRRQPTQRLRLRAASAPTATLLVCVANFSAVPHEDYRHRPADGRAVAGDHQHRRCRVRRLRRGQPRLRGGRRVPWHGRPASATLRIPPLGALWLRPA